MYTYWPWEKTYNSIKQQMCCFLHFRKILGQHTAIQHSWKSDSGKEIAILGIWGFQDELLGKHHLFLAVVGGQPGYNTIKSGLQWHAANSAFMVGDTSLSLEMNTGLESESCDCSCMIQQALGRTFHISVQAGMTGEVGSKTSHY